MIPYGQDPFLTVNMPITMATTYFDEHFDGHGDVTIWRYAQRFLIPNYGYDLELFKILWDHITFIIFSNFSLIMSFDLVILNGLKFHIHRVKYKLILLL